MSHRVWRLPDDVDTDALVPGPAMKLEIDEMARHCLESLRPGFAAGVRAGDVLVAGRNFGIGSSREQAATVLRRLGVAAVVAPSYSGLYWRSALNVGLLVLTCPDAGRIAEGESIEFDAREGWIRRCANGERLACEPIPPFLLEIVEAGGLLESLRRRIARKT